MLSLAAPWPEMQYRTLGRTGETGLVGNSGNHSFDTLPCEAADISFVRFFYVAAPYVVVATAATIWMGAKVFGVTGLKTDEERTLLNEIYEYNPLLFDFVSKRLLRHPESGQRFPPEMFTIPAGWEW